MSLELADRSIQYPRGIIENVLIKVDKFVLPIDFVILDMLKDSRIPIILGRPFLATTRATIDVFNKKITLRVGDDEVIFDVDQSIKRPPVEDDECYGIDDFEDTINAETQELLANDNKVDDDSDPRKPIQHIVYVNTPYSIAQEIARPNKAESKHLYSASANEIDEKKPGLKNLPHHLEYAYLHGDKSFPIIISSKLFEKEKMLLLKISIVPEDQENKTFTCPYGTFAYQRMPFGLCEVPANFQRCTTTIFHDMVEDFMEVFMDDFSLFGFDIEIKDKKGAKNLAADHLSRLENPELGTFSKEEITDEFLNEHLMILKAELNDDEPWYADYINYIVGKIMPLKWTPRKRRRRCVAGSEILENLAHCHSGPTGKHHSASITGRKVYESGFFWPSIFKDAKDYVMRCDACQRFVYGKACHLPMDIEHRAYWALKQCNMDLTAVAKNHFMELNELMELRDGAYVKHPHPQGENLEMA
nr:hypothetical protein [Tanacetum cinerariifolium]